jgi:hypothetical protein
MPLKQISLITIASGLALSLAGCSKSADKAIAEKAPESQATAEHDHSDWWCAEHGIPESQCALCNHKLAMDMKAKGDWCAKHDRPESECFICHPEYEAKFADLYVAKYGKAPPKPTAE